MSSSRQDEPWHWRTFVAFVPLDWYRRWSTIHPLGNCMRNADIAVAEFTRNNGEDAQFGSAVDGIAKRWDDWAKFVWSNSHRGASDPPLAAEHTANIKQSWSKLQHAAKAKVASGSSEEAIEKLLDIVRVVFDLRAAVYAASESLHVRGTQRQTHTQRDLIEAARKLFDNVNLDNLIWSDSVDTFFKTRQSIYASFNDDLGNLDLAMRATEAQMRAFEGLQVCLTPLKEHSPKGDDSLFGIVCPAVRRLVQQLLLDPIEPAQSSERSLSHSAFAVKQRRARSVCLRVLDF